MGLCWGASFLHKNSVCLFFCFQFFSFVSMLTFNILYICPNKYFIFQVLTYPGGFEILGRLVLLSYQSACIGFSILLHCWPLTQKVEKKTLKNHWSQWLASRTTLNSCQSHWKTIGVNGVLKKNINHSKLMWNVLGLKMGNHTMSLEWPAQEWPPLGGSLVTKDSKVSATNAFLALCGKYEQ